MDESRAAGPLERRRVVRIDAQVSAFDWPFGGRRARGYAKTRLNLGIGHAIQYQSRKQVDQVQFVETEFQHLSSRFMPLVSVL